MNKKELLFFLHTIDASPRKWLSQNFLIDRNIVAKIIEVADVRAKDKVLEIGPGAGAITTQLLDTGASVLAVEKDLLFAKELNRFQTPDNRLEVAEGDFLKFPLESIGKGWKIVANIPFKITAPILEKLCEHSHQFTSFTLVVQKEVTDRIKAKPKTKEYGSLTIFLQFYTTFDSALPTPSSCFYPRPEVDSTVVHLVCKEPPQGVDPDRFFFLVRKAFQQRRKMLTSSLHDVYPELRTHLEALEISLKARPEELSFDEWIRLYQTF
jgi:16S rRNA (adenine1518-N6/adenine1519-N6)-dimethyltransferase